MKNNFLFLNKTNNGALVIIGVNNIALIERHDDDSCTKVTLNFARDNSLRPHVELVKETMAEINKMING